MNPIYISWLVNSFIFTLIIGCIARWFFFAKRNGRNRVKFTLIGTVLSILSFFLASFTLRSSVGYIIDNYGVSALPSGIWLSISMVVLTSAVMVFLPGIGLFIVRIRTKKKQHPADEIDTIGE